MRHDRAKVLNLPSDWPGPLVQSLRHIASEDVLTAKLGEAWYRQHPDETTGDAIATASTTRSSVPPWMRSSALYWRKDRFGQAVLQIAVANAQRVPIYGDDDIIKLSGSSILVFASICQHIWDTWSRTASTVPTDSDRTDSVPYRMEWAHQDTGIRRVSAIWRDKIVETPAGHARQRLIDHIGKLMHSRLIADLSMSYPGANGFSFALADYSTAPELARHLDEAVAFGFMQTRPHTHRTSGRGPSQKWYLHPILSPYYEIPFSHTKEPFDATVAEFRNWLIESNVIEGALRTIKKRNSSRSAPTQLDLFSTDTDEGTREHPRDSQ